MSYKVHLWQYGTYKLIGEKFKLLTAHYNIFLSFLLIHPFRVASISDCSSSLGTSMKSPVCSKICFSKGIHGEGLVCSGQTDSPTVSTSQQMYSADNWVSFFPFPLAHCLPVCTYYMSVRNQFNLQFNKIPMNFQCRDVT